MKFKYKSAEEIGKMSAEEQEKYLADKRKHEKSERVEEIKEALKPLNDGQVEIKEDIDVIKDEVNVLKEKVRTENGNEDSPNFKELFKEKADEIESVFKAKSGSVEIYKTPAVVTTQNGTLGNALPNTVGTQLAPMTDVSLREMGVLPLVRTGKTNLPAYVYTEVTPKDGDFEVVEEGKIKPMVDLQWETRSITPKKIAAVTKLTEESVTDYAGLEDIVENFLFKKHNLKKSKSVLFGDGTGANPKGATKYARAFTAGSLAASIVKPNVMDVINSCVTNIFTTHNYEDELEYMPNVAMLNPVDFMVHFVSAKDNEGKPLYPTATLFGRVDIGGLTIIPEQSIEQGKIFVADLSKYNVLDYVGYSVRVAWENDDMRRNQFMLIAESRFYQFVKKADELAFIYDDIETIKTAITKP